MGLKLLSREQPPSDQLSEPCVEPDGEKEDISSASVATSRDDARCFSGRRNFESSVTGQLDFGRALRIGNTYSIHCICSEQRQSSFSRPKDQLCYGSILLTVPDP